VIDEHSDEGELRDYAAREGKAFDSLRLLHTTSPLSVWTFHAEYDLSPLAKELDLASLWGGWASRRPDYYALMREAFEQAAPKFPLQFPPLILFLGSTRYYVGDGHHRLSLCQLLHISTAPVVLGKFIDR